MSVIIFLDRDFLRPASPLFSPLPSTKPVLFIPGPGSQNQMFGLASVHNGQLGLQIFLGSHLVWFSAYIILRILADKLGCPYHPQLSFRNYPQSRKSDHPSKLPSPAILASSIHCLAGSRGEICLYRRCKILHKKIIFSHITTKNSGSLNILCFFRSKTVGI